MPHTGASCRAVDIDGVKLSSGADGRSRAALTLDDPDLV
jgi:hypothetical protein